MTKPSKELVEQANTDVQAAPAINSNDIFTKILALADDPEKAGAIDAMANLAMKMQDREAERRFQMAKHNALLKMPYISKTGAIVVNNQVRSRYSTFEDIDRVTRPILAENRLTLTFNVDQSGEKVAVQPVLAYADDTMVHVEEGGWMPLSIDTTGSKNATQGAGSSVSYGKRQQAKAVLNIIEVGEDNDGQTIELSEDHRKLIEAGRDAAKEGTEHYSKWFEGLPQGEKGFLGYTPGSDGVTFHQRNKEAAKLFD